MSIQKMLLSLSRLCYRFDTDVKTNAFFLGLYDILADAGIEFPEISFGDYDDFSLFLQSNSNSNVAGVDHSFEAATQQHIGVRRSIQEDNSKYC